MIAKDLVELLEFAVIGDNKHLIKENEILGKDLLDLSATGAKSVFESYWKLDGNAFGDMSAEKWVKMDYCVLGGFPVVMYIPTKCAGHELVKTLGTEHGEYTPIGFMDMHPVGSDTFLVSGLGIAQPYQGKGLSKYLIYAGIKISGAKKLKVPTQLSNEKAHFAWGHVGELKKLYEHIAHSKEDTIVYLLDIPEVPEQVLKPKNYKKF